jgi:CRP/FNR family transcriptional regulator
MYPMYERKRNGAPQPRKAGEFFNSLSPGALRDFLSKVVPVRIPARAMLFQEEQECRGLLLLLEGCAKISVNSVDGRRLILWIARAPELLGLTVLLSGGTYEVTAETLDPCRVASIPRKSFLDFLRRHPTAYQSVARELSLEISRACEQMRILGLPSSASVKLARLLFEWSEGGRMIHEGTCVSIFLTHEEMGECIGATRETASRAMAELRQRRLIDMRGKTLIVPNRFALDAYARGVQGATLSAGVSRVNSDRAKNQSQATVKMLSQIHLEPPRERKSYPRAAGQLLD